MNFNILIAGISLAGGIAYLIVTQIKASKYNMPFFKALNPNYTARVHELAGVQAGLQPIIDELETKRLATFVANWTAKFEKGTLTAADLQMLNKLIEEGKENQVAGILSLHPEAKKQFDALNEKLNPVAAEAELVG